jgi:hypothetical protein
MHKCIIYLFKRPTSQLVLDVNYFYCINTFNFNSLKSQQTIGQAKSIDMTTSKNVFSKLEVMIFFKFFQGYFVFCSLDSPRGSSAPPLEYRLYWGLVTLCVASVTCSRLTPVKNMKIRLCYSYSGVTLLF